MSAPRLSLYRSRLTLALTLLFSSLTCLSACEESSAPPPLEGGGGSAVSAGGASASQAPKASPVALMGCKGEPECAAEGLCDRSPEGACIATTPKACLQSLMCKKEGRCTPQKGRCVVASDLDCQQGERCAKFGVCVAQEGRCVVTEERDCERSQACLELGTCKLMDGRCVTQEEWSAGCGPNCLRARGTCVCAPPPPAPKALTPEVACISDCNTEGRCVFGKHTCYAKTDEMCRRSTACLMHGRCASVPRTCAPGEPNCNPADRVCAPSEEGCVRSLGCKILGLCDLASQAQGQWSGCVATSEKMCRRSLACTQVGLCDFASRAQPDEAQGEVTAPQPLSFFNTPPPSDVGDCVFSSKNKSCGDLCERLGRCSPNEVGTCVALMNSECLTADVCRRYGLCSAQRGACVAKSDEDCQRGQNCKMFGYCTAREGKCVQQ